MCRLPVLFVIGALWSVLVAAEALDCTNKTAVQTEKNNCLIQFGITTDSDIDQVQEDIKKHLNATCRDIDKYKSALSCAITTERNCMEETGGNPKTLSDSKKLSEGLTYLCDNVEEVDGPCYNRVNPTLRKCINDKFKAEFSGTSDIDTNVARCKTFEFGFDCMDEHLGQCGEKTKEVFVTYAKYVIPPACAGAPFIHAASLWVLSLAALLAVLLGSSLDF